jgi:YVTN family beta-propeller protein
MCVVTAVLLAVSAADAFATSGTLYVTNYEASGAVVPVALPGLAVGSAITSNVGSYPGDIAITPDGSQAFTGNLGPASVSAIDTSSNTATLLTGSTFTSPQGVAVTPDGSEVVVTNVNGTTVTFVNASTHAVSPVAVTVGTMPWAVAVTPDGKFAYVANNGGTVSVIDMGTDTVATTISSNLPADPCGLSITPDGAKIVVIGGCNAVSGGVSIIDTQTNTAAAVTSPFGTHQIRAVAVSPAGSPAYVYDTATGDIWQLDPNTGTVPASPLVNGLAGIQDLAVSPDGSTLYATAILAHNVQAIDTATGTRTPSTSSVSNKPWADALTPDQAPHAALSVKAKPAGSPSTLSAAASTTSDGGPATYAWNFGDGGTATTSSPTISHVYAKGNYTAAVTVADDAGCSTNLVYTGQTASCNGGPSANATAPVAIASPQRPNTKITKAKISRRAGKAKFTFKAVKVAATGFQCALKSKHRKPKFRSCKSPKTYRHVKRGRYTFEVRAFDAAGKDPTPAKKRFSIK